VIARNSGNPLFHLPLSNKAASSPPKKTDPVEPNLMSKELFPIHEALDLDPNPNVMLKLNESEW
jgi:hypothetical protein